MTGWQWPLIVPSSLFCQFDVTKNLVASHKFFRVYLLCPFSFTFRFFSAPFICLALIKDQKSVFSLVYPILVKCSSFIRKKQIATCVARIRSSRSSSIAILSLVFLHNERVKWQETFLCLGLLLQTHDTHPSQTFLLSFTSRRPLPSWISSSFLSVPFSLSTLKPLLLKHGNVLNALVALSFASSSSSIISWPAWVAHSVFFGLGYTFGFSFDGQQFSPSSSLKMFRTLLPTVTVNSRFCVISSLPGYHTNATTRLFTAASFVMFFLLVLFSASKLSVNDFRTIRTIFILLPSLFQNVSNWFSKVLSVFFSSSGQSPTLWLSFVVCHVFVLGLSVLYWEKITMWISSYQSFFVVVAGGSAFTSTSTCDFYLITSTTFQTKFSCLRM